MERIDDVLDKIKINRHVFPQKELEELIENGEQVIPKLLHIMEDVRDNYQTYDEERSMLPFYASYLLAQFRVKKFFPILMEIAELPAEILFRFYGDGFTEDFHRIMISVFDGNLKLIYDLIENPNAHIYVRVEAVISLCCFVVHEIVERNVIIDYLKNFIYERGEGEDPEFIALIIASLSSIYPGDSFEAIQWAYENDLVALEVIGLHSVQKQLEIGEEETLAACKKRLEFQYVGSVIEEIPARYFFSKNQEQLEKEGQPKTIVKGRKIGRNEPCPCGSGKKYKKCCGKK